MSIKEIVIDFKKFRGKLQKACSDVWVGNGEKKILAITLDRVKNQRNLASSNEKDIVADFFCGSGTTLTAAKKLNRKGIGVDNNPKAIELCKERIKIKKE